MRLPLLLVFLLLLTGCTLRFSSSQVRDGGIFRSSDFGERWEQKVFVRQEGKKTVTISDVDAASIVVSPHSKDELMLTTLANGVLLTVDGGETWRATSLNVGHYPAFAYDPQNSALLYTATRNSILKSSDGGTAWDVIYTDARGETITALAIDSFDSSKIYAGTSGGTVLKSLNYGNEWAVKHAVSDPVRAILVRPDDTRILFVVTTNKGIVRTNDGGETWTPLLQAMSKFPGSAVVYQAILAPNAPATMFLATKYGLLKSADSGETWDAIKTLIPFGTLPPRTVAVDSENQSVLYFTVNNLLHKTEDGGLTWRTIETIPTSRLITKLIAHPGTLGLLFLGTMKVKR